MEFTWDQGAYESFLNGPVMNLLIDKAIRVEAQAKINATDRPGPKVRTGRLRGSITWTANQGNPPSVDIGSNVVYAIYVERGHINKKHFFKAPAGYDGPTVYAKDGTKLGWVSDRPTKAYPFLEPALSAARS